MNTTVSTADVHPRDAFDYWHEELCKKVVPHDCTPEDRQTFSAKTQSAPLADIALVQYESTPMENDVTGRHVARANSDELLIRLQTAGIFLFEQDGREGVLEAGDILLFDTRRPFRGRYLNGAKELILKVPRRQLEARIGDVRQAVARPIKRLEAEHGLTSSYLEMLPTYSGRLDAAAAELVRDHALDLVALSLAKAMDRGKPRLSSARSLVLVNVRVAVEARLSDPSLDAAAVAAAAGVSVRYANTVLAEDGTSITRLIWSRRLERCRGALEDPKQAHRRLSEIAYSWGFSDMTHFGRSFRAAFGLLPSEYRRVAHEDHRASGGGAR
ncbi:helix-turn-helix domain-containing protein [Mesorhizobium sp. VK22B]|uniref:Helix-turn-helix domain-containing protein n=1 Tax=Mesorhizobium captivum TaxID=3072319 RepID=A0ABU4ZDE8_9HYPH|nr:helix-turn-helix domain-containing protein [Mesorhizobium sp. VK22B]MDX8496583.1 helix-turn-helix domain-containing protein [Mesorhizobium sp. VK22B]